MRKLLGRAAEDFREPPDSFLMRYVHKVAVAKDIRQAVWAGVRLRHFLGRPTVAPPSYKRERKENRDGSYCKNCSQSSLSHTRKSGLSSSQRLPSSQTALGLDLKGQSYPLPEHGEGTTFNRSIAVAYHFGGRLR